jgi:hypothetical protein
MHKFLTICCAAGLLAAAFPVAGQDAAPPKAPAKKRERASPHDKVEATIGGKTITIEYGRPAKKGREIFGKLVPYGQVWRAGADERTKLTTSADLMLGSLHVPAGSYSLWALPGENEWTLIVNKQAGGWGAQWDYEAKIKQDELGRVKMKLESVPSVEQFTITLTPGSGNRGTLTLSWDTVKASLGVMVH